MQLSERISRLKLEEQEPEDEGKAAGPSSSGLRPEDKGKAKLESESASPEVSDCDWKPVSEFPQTLSSNTQPSFRQVVLSGSK